MENNTLGKRIKEARLAKKMTQSEVVGDFITRNMLSQIESGSATPSVKTLEYLCKVLEIEPNALLPDENDSKNAPDAEGYISIRKEFINKNYKAVIEYDADDEFSDEICALKAKACLMVAREYSGSDSGLGADFVIVPIMLIVFLVVLLLVIFGLFVYSAVKLTGTKSVKGKFVRFGRAEGKKFDTAFYKVSDSEYPNVFPCEVVMRSKIYIPDKVCRLRYDGKRNEVFDLNAVCCVIFGLVLSSVSAVMMILFLLTVIGVN